MIISLSVEIFKNLSDNQKRLLKEFNQELTQKNSPESSGFFSKLETLGRFNLVLAMSKIKLEFLA